MTKEEVIYECEDMVQLQHLDALMKKNTVKFHEYINQHELLRIRFFLTDDVCKFLKTWIRTTYEDIISLKSQFNELGRLYGILLKDNFIKEFFDYSNSLEILQLKLVETVMENKRLKTNVDAANKEVEFLKSEYENLTRTYEELSQNNFAAKFLNFVKPREALKLKIAEKLEECQSLEVCVDEACAKILTLNSELDKSIRRYQILSDDNNVQEFLSQAKYQAELRLKSTENLNKRIASLELQLKKTRELLKIERQRRKIVNEGGCSTSSLFQSKKQTASLEFQLKKARDLLNKERCRIQKIENERDSSARLSEDLCRLLSKHLDGKSLEKVKERNINGDYAQPGISNINGVVSNSSSSPVVRVLEWKNDNIKEINFSNTTDCNNTQDHQISCSETDSIEPVVVKKEKTDDESLISLDVRVVEPHELSNPLIVLKSTNGYLEKINVSNNTDFNVTQNHQTLCTETECIEPVVVKEEKPDDESLIDRPMELSDPNINHNSPSVGKTAVIGSSTESNVQCGTSSLQSAVSSRREVRKYTKNLRSSTKVSKNKLSKVKPRLAKSLPKKSAPEVSQKLSSDNLEDISFRCDECKKSFVVKPNERKPQKCPICEMKSYKSSNHRVNRNVS